MSLGGGARGVAVSPEPPQTPFCLLGAEGTIKRVNPAFEHVTGYSETELLGEPWRKLGSRNLEGSQLIIEECAKTGDAWRGQLKLQRKDGAELDVYGMTAPLEDECNDPLGVVLTLTGDTDPGHNTVWAESKTRNDLERFRHVTTSLSGLARNLVQTTDQETAIRMACMQLATSEVYSAAWFGEYVPASSQIRATEIVGMDESYLAQIESKAQVHSGLVQRAIRSNEVLAERNLLSDHTDRESIEDAVARGYQSRAVVPVVTDGGVCGVLGVFSSNPDAFDVDERELLQDIGYILGHVFKSAKQQQLLHSETVLELEFRVRGRESIFVTATDDLTCHLELESVIKNSAEWYLAYLSVDGADPGAVANRFSASSDIGKVRTIDADGKQGTLELEVRNGVLATVRDHGGIITDVSVANGEMTVRGKFLPTVDIRSIHGEMKRINADVELAKKRERKRKTPPAADPAAPLIETLTERQREVLGVAYHAGYFSSPRHSDGQHLADSLEISSAAFYELIRRSVRNLLDHHFGERDSKSPFEERK